MYCNHCGAKVAQDARFCAQCGHTTNHKTEFRTPPMTEAEDMEATRLISSEEIQKALRDSQKKESQPPLQEEKTPAPASSSLKPSLKAKADAAKAPKVVKEVRPAWVDEKDDPAIYNKVAHTEATPKKAPMEKGALGNQLGSAWQKVRLKMDENREERLAKKAKAAKANHTPEPTPAKGAQGPAKAKMASSQAAPGSLQGQEAKDSKGLFAGFKAQRKASVEAKEDNPTKDLFIFLYIAVISVALVIGVVLGLFIIRPWASSEDENVQAQAEATAAVVWQAPVATGF